MEFITFIISYTLFIQKYLFVIVGYVFPMTIVLNLHIPLNLKKLITKKSIIAHFDEVEWRPLWKMAAVADQGKILSGSISRIIQNMFVNMCTKFGAFMKK